MPGILSVCTNKQLLQNYATMSRIIIVDDETITADIQQAYGALMGTILLPTYITLSHIVDGDINTFTMEYLNHLQRGEAMEYFAVILRALFNGTNITLYLESNELSNIYTKVLLDYMYNTFGIVAAVNMTNQSMIDPNRIGFIMDILYSFDLCSDDELFKTIGNNHIFTQPTLTKLIQTYRPFINSNRPEDYAMYFINFANHYKQNNSAPEQLIRKVGL